MIKGVCTQKLIPTRVTVDGRDKNGAASVFLCAHPLLVQKRLSVPYFCCPAMSRNMVQAFILYRVVCGFVRQLRFVRIFEGAMLGDNERFFRNPLWVFNYTSTGLYSAMFDDVMNTEIILRLLHLLWLAYRFTRCHHL